MRNGVKNKLEYLDPKIKKKVEALFRNMNESISMLYEIATHDEKTGLYNHKFFENMIDMEVEKAKRGKQRLSILMVDIDFFKKINDKYGHIKADELLAKLAKVLQKQIRESDIAARFGGEEFVILLPETSLENAKILAERIKNAIHKDSFLKKHRLTISGGITEFKKRDSKKTFKSRADKALYEAKKNGRDRFEVK